MYPNNDRTIMGKSYSKEKDREEKTRNVVHSSNIDLSDARPMSSISSRTVPTLSPQTHACQDLRLNIHPGVAHFLQHVVKLYAIKLKVDDAVEQHLPRNFMSQYDIFTQTDRMKQVSLDGRSEQLALEDVMEAAVAAQPVFNETMCKLVEAIGLDPNAVVWFNGKPLAKNDGKGKAYCRLMIGPLKGEIRCREKACHDYQGNYGQLVDVVRCSVILDTEEQLISMTQLLLESGRVIRLKNRFRYPLFTGYRDALFNILVTIPNGVEHVCEVQAHLVPIIFCKAASHEMYNLFRSIFPGRDVSIKQHIDAVVEFATVELKGVIGPTKVASIEGQDSRVIVQNIIHSDNEKKLDALATLLKISNSNNQELLHLVEAKLTELAGLRKREMTKEEDIEEAINEVGKSMIDLALLRREVASAEALRAEADFLGAKRLYEKVLAGYQEVPGEELSVAATYSNLGFVDRSQGKNEEARANYQKALDIRLKKLGQDHIDVAATYNDLGDVEEADDEHEKAKTYYQKALEIQVKVFGQNHVAVADAEDSLGLLVQSQGNYEEAEAHFQKALVIYVNELGEKLGECNPLVARAKQYLESNSS